ncbi:MAG TPA: response regulator [Bacteroidetes bacterium]|nr:response regulator [Bacteroidota bacterium]
MSEQKKKVALVADDSSTIRKLISLTLKSRGTKVVTASDGMEALELLPTLDVDLIITDLNMPNIDGYEFIRIVRENDYYQDVPIIILSSEKEKEDIERGIAAGANSYLVKPFVPEKLQSEVEKYLS